MKPSLQQIIVTWPWRVHPQDQWHNVYIHCHSFFHHNCSWTASILYSCTAVQVPPRSEKEIPCIEFGLSTFGEAGGTCMCFWVSCVFKISQRCDAQLVKVWNLWFQRKHFELVRQMRLEMLSLKWSVSSLTSVFWLFRDLTGGQLSSR